MVWTLINTFLYKFLYKAVSVDVLGQRSAMPPMKRNANGQMPCRYMSVSIACILRMGYDADADCNRLFHNTTIQFLAFCFGKLLGIV